MAQETELIRRATPADVEAISRLLTFVQRLHAEVEPDWFTLPEHELFAPEFVQETMHDSDHDYFVAIVAGEIVGYALVKEIRRPASPFSPVLHHLSLEQICVHPDYRRRGLAGALLAQVRQEAQRRGVSGIQLGIWQFNEASRAFFTGAGFVPKQTRYYQALS